MPAPWSDGLAAVNLLRTCPCWSLASAWFDRAFAETELAKDSLPVAGGPARLGISSSDIGSTPAAQPLAAL